MRRAAVLALAAVFALPGMVGAETTADSPANPAQPQPTDQSAPVTVPDKTAPGQRLLTPEQEGRQGIVKGVVNQSFRDFGLIGAVGMILCWIATYWTMPAILVVLERVSPIRFIDVAKYGPPSSRVAVWRRFRDVWARTFGLPFAWLVVRIPRTIVVFGLALSALGVALVVRYSSW